MPDTLSKLLRNEPATFGVKAVPLNQCYQCTIDDVFEEVAQFAELVDYLNNACEGDIAHIRLSTPGGAVHAVIPLLEAMRNTEAHIALHVESDVASAGTFLMMLAHEVYINPFSTIMLHTCNYGYGGHAGNVDAYVQHTTKLVDKLVNDLYSGFLSNAEIARMLDGKEIYLTDEDCYSRFKSRDQAVLSKLAEANKPPKKPRVKRVKPVVETT